MSSIIQEPSGFPLTRLPNEIIWSIIDQLADDVEALSNLCEAARDIPGLLLPALKKRWQKVTIDDRDLVPAPGDIDFNDNENLLRRYGLGKTWQPPGHGIYALLEEVGPNNLRAANYVQHLTFNMQMLRYFSSEVANTEIRSRDLSPSLASFEYSFALIEPHLLALRSLAWDGEPLQRIWSLFTQSKHFSKIRSLSLQRLLSPGTLRSQEYSSTGSFTWQRRPINLESLQCLGGLRKLGVHRFAAKEIPSLLSCLPLLSHLVTLELGDDDNDSEEYDHVCAIDQLVHQLLTPTLTGEGDGESQSRRIIGLPASLNSLTLLERHYTYPESVPAPAANIGTLESPLRDLCIIAEGSHLLHQFAASFVKAQLKNLMLPGPACLFQNYRHFEDTNLLVLKHANTLSRITILNAWELEDRFAKNFNQRWQGKFEVRELVLGTASNTWSTISPAEWLQEPSPALRYYLDGVDGYVSALPPKIDLWGDRLERIRIDDVKSWALDTAILGHSRFSQLRILMLQPFDKGSILTVGQFARSYGCKPINESTARHLAQQILETSASTLRVVIIQNYWYWISALVLGKEDERLWSWIDAKSDSEQSKTMSKVLHANDWAFFRNTTPRLWNERLREASATPPTWAYNSESAAITGIRWNYVTILPVDDGRVED